MRHQWEHTRHTRHNVANVNVGKSFHPVRPLSVFHPPLSFGSLPFYRVLNKKNVNDTCIKFESKREDNGTSSRTETSFEVCVSRYKQFKLTNPSLCSARTSCFSLRGERTRLNEVYERTIRRVQFSRLLDFDVV